MYCFVILMCLLKFGIYADISIGNSKMSVNGRDIDIMRSKNLYKGEYRYVNGELAKFTCIRDGSGKTYNMHNITYQDQGNQHSFKGINYNTMSLYIKLKKENSPEHIDCNLLSTFNTSILQTIRITLTNEVKNYPKFKVNRLLLSPLIPRTEYNLTYSYEYYFGEKLNITFDSSVNSINCNSSDTIIGENVKDISKTSLNVTLNTEKFVNDTSSFKCSLKINYYYYDIELKLVRIQYPESYSQITGVSLSKIISKYTNTSRIRENVTYPYYNNEPLVLSCSNATWIFNDNYVVGTRLDDSLSPFIEARSFQLKENVNSSVLFCNATKEPPNYKENSQMVLVRSEYIKDDPVWETTPSVIVSDSSTKANENDIDRPGIANANPSTSDSPPSTEENDNTEKSSGLDPQMFYIIIGAVVGVIIISIILITLIACKMKNKVHQKADTDINYENLPEHNEGSMPVPSQWSNEYANSTDNLYNNVNNEPTYAKPIPKSKRNKLVTEYSVPQTSNDPSYDYATPYNANESPYTEIVPPSQRNPGPKFNRNPENSNYAQVIPKSQRNNVNLNKVLPTMNDYAEIDPIRGRANTDKNKYANVFDKERYVNAKSSDYVEPAYASIDSLK